MSYGSNTQPSLFKFFFENEKNSMSYGSKPQPSLSKKNSEKNLKKFLCPTTKPSEDFIKKNCEKKLLEKFLCPMDLILSQDFLNFFFLK